MNISSIKSKLKDPAFLLTSAVYVTLFIYLINPYRDYDWGWHFRYGEYLLKTGHIMTADIWTWTMQGYHWVNHSWLYDPIAYLIFKYSSFTGMTLAGAAITFAAFYISIKRFKLSFWQKGILAYFYFQLTSGVFWQGLRSQLFGVLFIAVLLWLIEKTLNKSKKYALLLPPLFLLWANLHGSFVIGLSILGLYTAGEIIAYLFSKKTKTEKGLFINPGLVYLSLLSILAIAATFINPFTYRVYTEALKHFSNPLLPYILEWTPAQFPSYFYNVFLAYSAFLVFVLIKRHTIKDLPYFLISVFYFYMAAKARRYNADFMIATLPYAALCLKSLNLNFEKFKTTYFVSIICTLIALEQVIPTKVSDQKILNYNSDAFCSLGPGCSEKVTNYLIDHPPQGKGFNFYDWGGYLIGRGFGAKLFIDGRMHLWRDKSRLEPFYAYQQMMYEGNWDMFNSYGFDWVLIPPGTNLAAKIRENKDLGTWKEVYRDQKMDYFVREK